MSFDNEAVEHMALQLDKLVEEIEQDRANLASCSLEKDNKLEYAVSDFKQMFQDHVTGEMAQYKEIDSKLGELLAMLRAHEGAFPKDEDGLPDFHGHRKYHRDLMQRAVDREVAKQQVIHRVLAGSGWAVVVFLGMAVWDSVLKHIGGMPK